MVALLSKKTISMLAVAVTLLMVAGCGGGGGAPAAQAPSEITLGLTAPMTGDYAEYGTVFKNAAELAIEKVNAKGGINGKKLKLVVGDSKADPKEAANIAQKFVSDAAVMAVIGDFTSTAALAGAPIYQKGGLVQLSPTSSHPDFTKQGTFIFRNIASQAVEGPALADYAVKDLAKKKVAVVYIKNDWGLVAQEYFVKRTKEIGAAVVAVEPYLPEQGKDFSAIITKIKEQKPDLIYLGMMYTDGALFAQQVKKANFDVALCGTGALYSSELVKLGGSAVEGLYLTVSFFPDDPKPEVQEFVKGYEAKYGKLPTQFAAQAYDAANLIIEALKKWRKRIEDASAK